MNKQDTTKQAYAKFCQSLDHCPVFCQPWYLDAVAENGNWEVVLAEEKGQVVAALPFFVKERLGLRYVTMPLFTKFMGPLVAPAYRELKYEHRLCQQLIDQLPPLAGFDQQFHPGVQNWLPFYWQGYRQTTQYTYVLKLAGEADWRAGVNRNMRRNLDKAESQLRLRHDLGLDTFYQLNEKSFARQNKAVPYSFDQLKRHDEALVANESRQLFFAVDEQDRVHSAAYLIWDKQRAYYHLSGDDPNLRQSGSGIWLVAQAVQYTQQELQLPFFDFEGSMLPEVEAIRRQFGATQVPYSRVWKINSPIYAILKHLRSKS